MTISNKNSIFIMGFDESQLLILFSILRSFCKKNSISKIIFGQNISQKILKTEIAKKIFYKKKIIFLKKNLKISTYIKIFFFLFFFSPKILKMTLTLSPKKLLDKKLSWYDCQLYHSVWDLCYLNQKEDQLAPSFFSKFYYSIVVYVNIFYAKILHSLDTKVAFMGHLVYAPKAIIAELRKLGVKIYGHTMESYFLIKKNEDTMWSIIDKSFLDKINTKKINKITDIYWNRRILGLGNSFDTRIAAKKKINLTTEAKKSKNIIMLHIFKDSPFNFIDRNRIFADYYEWVEKTLEILTMSRENWLVRIHPNAKRWGENSEKIFNRILESVISKTKKNPNITLDIGEYSNIQLFKNADRVVTFSGTSHLEAACFGIKPIVISHVTLSKFDKNLVIKPKNLDEYKSLLLKNSNEQMRICNNKNINLAKKILFIIENILTFQKDIKFETIYRSDPKEKLTRLYNIALAQSKKNMIYFDKISIFLESKFKRTLSLKYIKYYKL